MNLNDIKEKRKQNKIKKDAIAKYNEAIKKNPECKVFESPEILYYEGILSFEDAKTSFILEFIKLCTSLYITDEYVYTLGQSEYAPKFPEYEAAVERYTTKKRYKTRSQDAALIAEGVSYPSKVAIEQNLDGYKIGVLFVMNCYLELLAKMYSKEYGGEFTLDQPFLYDVAAGMVSPKIWDDYLKEHHKEFFDYKGAARTFGKYKPARPVYYRRSFDEYFRYLCNSIGAIARSREYRKWEAENPHREFYEFKSDYLNENGYVNPGSLMTPKEKLTEEMIALIPGEYDTIANFPKMDWKGLDKDPNFHLDYNDPDTFARNIFEQNGLKYES